MSLKTLLESILPFLFSAAEKQWDHLTKEQQDSILNGTGIAQIIKENLGKDEDAVKQLIVEKTGLPIETVNATIGGILDNYKLKAFTELQDLLKAAENTLNWNGLLTTIGSIAGIVLSGGTITWESLLMGLLQFAYEKFIKPKTA